MKKCLVIARNTFREAVRDRILYLIAVFAALLILFSKALGWVSVERDAEIIGDLSLYTISLFAVVIAIFVGTGLIFKEMDKRTIYTILSKPVDRWQFVVGKYLGLAMTISLVALLMELFFLAFVGVQGYLPSGDALRMLVYALVLVHGEIIIITAVAITFSLITSPILAAVLTLVVWLAGNAADEIVYFSQYFQELHADTGEGVFNLLAHATSWIYCVTPHLNYYAEVKRYAFWPDPPRMEEITALTVGGRLGYAIAYAAALLCISVLFFRRKSF